MADDVHRYEKGVNREGILQWRERDVVKHHDKLVVDGGVGCPERVIMGTSFLVIPK